MRDPNGGYRGLTKIKDMPAMRSRDTAIDEEIKGPFSISVTAETLNVAQAVATTKIAEMVEVAEDQVILIFNGATPVEQAHSLVRREDLPFRWEFSFEGWV